MKIKHSVMFVTFCFLLSCKKQEIITYQAEQQQLIIDSTLIESDSIKKFITPFTDHLNKELNKNLCYTNGLLTKNDGKLESSLGNLMADLCLEQANPVFLKRTETNIDFVLLNHGGVRAPIAKGNITPRNAFEVMPFENELVVVELNIEKVKELLLYLAKSKKAHPVANISLEIEDNNFFNVLISDKPLEMDRNYFVLTSDYLQQGGDRMNFFANPVSLHKLDYKLRNAMIDYFEKTDTITPKLDQRFRYAN